MCAKSSHLTGSVVRGARGARTEYLSKHGREPGYGGLDRAVMQVSNKHRIPGSDLTTYAASGLHLRRLALVCGKVRTSAMLIARLLGGWED